MTLKSCVTCPSYLADDEAIKRRFKKAPGTAMCGRYGHVLGKPLLDSTEIVTHFAMKCDSHNKAMTETPVTIVPKVVMVDGSILARDTSPDELGTCSGCEHMVLQSDVFDTWGWNVPICRAKGTLILSPMAEARNCPWASKGEPTTGVLGLTLIDELTTGFAVDEEVKLKALLGSTEIVEPSTYPTDLVVAPDDVALGIRAWRRYLDDETGNDYYLPIFDRDFFTDEEQRRIPKTGEQFGKTGVPELYVDHNHLMMTFLKDSYSLDETLCLTGEPGNGKSQFGIFLAWTMQVPFEKFAIRPDMNVEDFIGHPSVDPAKGDYYVLGRLPRRWTRPGVIVSDEYNGGPDDVSFLYRDLLDSGVVRIDYEGGGMSLEKNDYLFHLVTMNPAWDMRNIGTRELADADSSRLSFAWVAEPPEAIMRHILKTWCARDDYTLPDKTLDKIIKIGRDIRELSKQSVFPGSWGLRQEIKVARKTAHYATLEQAYRRASLDSLDPAIAAIIVQAIESYGT